MPEILERGHEIVSGTTGMGKSYWLLYKVVQSLIHGVACCLLDAKGETYRLLVAFLAMTQQGRLLWQRWKDRILLLNPVSPSGYALSMNAIAPLERFADANPDLVALVANALVSHIRRQSGFEMAEANRMQNIMSAAISLLAEAGRGAYSLAELPLLFHPTRPAGKGEPAPAHNAFVRALLGNAQHLGTLSFWHDQWPTWTPPSRRDWVQSTEGRIYQYLFDERVLTATCAVEHATLDFRQVVNEGYWLFVNLPYAFLSDTHTTLLGNLIITGILYASMQRPPGSRPYRLILDEARFFNTGPLDTILEMARAYGLWMTLAVQSVDQLCRAREGRVDERLKELVLGLCRYFSVFHNAQDAELMARLMFPLTGQVPMDVRASGDWEYLPTLAEQNEHVRRFMRLRQREMVFFDRLGSAPARVWRTPEVIMDPPVESIIQRFEAEHLQRTGRAVADIRAEIVARRKRLREAFFGDTEPVAARREPPRRHPRARFGDQP